MERLIVVRCPTLLASDEEGVALRRFAKVLDVVGTFCPWVTVIRPGVCSLPARGPARFFGGEERLAERIRLAVSVTDDVGPIEVGIADGLFAALLAAQAGVIVPVNETPNFLAPWPAAVLGQPDLDTLLGRLGLDTLGAFAELPERHVLGRFGTEGIACHRVARGIESELPDLREPGVTRTLAALSTTNPPSSTQEDFWAGRHEQRRAARALLSLQELLGPEAVRILCRKPGRHPDDEVRLLTWSPQEAHTPRPTKEPWPGHLPSPSPAVVHHRPIAAELDGDRGPVRVAGRGGLSTTPIRLLVDGRPNEVVAWAGPWPTWERWWQPNLRRTAHLQVMTEGPAHLLRSERGAWWLVATYD